MKPPNFRQQPARFGARCTNCAHHYERAGMWGPWGRCDEYDRGVLPNDVCDSWERSAEESYSNPSFV